MVSFGRTLIFRYTLFILVIFLIAEIAGFVPSFVEKEKRRNLLLTKQIAQRGEGGIRREEGYHD
jgi:hypothetical protein